MKPIEFCGRSLVSIRAFPASAKREAGLQLDRIQRDLDPIDWKPMPSIGKGVKEVRIKEQGEYRVIYIAKFKETIYILHAFQKKTQKTRIQDIETAKRALKDVYERMK
ncbi:MAG: type II toxin-antitoxin system RelE/ParE family toxin [Nitrospiria bacterium]